MKHDEYDVTIVGGGPAGLSAALILARCRRRVLLIDSGQGRNRAAAGLHGFLTRDGVRPEFLRSVGRSELKRYGVATVDGEVAHAERRRDGTFLVRYARRGKGVSTDLGGAGGASCEEEGNFCATSRRLLLATGVRDLLPEIEGIGDFYGISVHHCPYCDGWEHRDGRLVAYGPGNAAVGLGLALRCWSADVTACTAGVTPDKEMLEQARAQSIRVIEHEIVRLEGEDGRLEEVVLAGGGVLRCDALFFNTGQVQRSPLPRLLGCSFKDDGGVWTDDRQCTGVPGLYLAGDADKEVQFVVVAAAEGATAAVAINRSLQDEEAQRAGGGTGRARGGLLTTGLR